MPCVKCGTRNSDRKDGMVVATIHRREDGETYYTCLSCAIEMMKEEFDE